MPKENHNFQTVSIKQYFGLIYIVNIQIFWKKFIKDEKKDVDISPSYPYQYMCKMTGCQEIQIQIFLFLKPH